MITTNDEYGFSPSAHSFRNKVGRVLWAIIYTALFRPSPKVFHSWRVFLLRLFGAKIGRDSYVYSTVKVWAPWNLQIGDYSCLAHDVDCYCVDKIVIGNRVTVSQYSYLCTASHDYTEWDMPLKTARINLEDNSWICTGAFVGPGVLVGEGSVVAARAVVTKPIEPWSVVGGNPARFIKARVMTKSL